MLRTTCLTTQIAAVAQWMGKVVDLPRPVSPLGDSKVFRS